jgi:hypothetical protein
MRNLEVSTPRPVDDVYAWLAEGSLPASREDRIAEGIALVALAFSFTAGIVIAMLPVSSPIAPSALVATGNHVTR